MRGIAVSFGLLAGAAWAPGLASAQPLGSTTTVATAPPSTRAGPEAKAYVLVDVSTGNVLASYHEHQRLRPGSLTKVLTALVAATYLPADAAVTGTKQSGDAYPDNVGMQNGVAWPLAEVLQSLLVMSANDAAYALAQRVSGSLSAFGLVMDRSARQIGMSDDPVFHDPAGLDGAEGIGGGNYVSARDLAVAGRDLLRVPLLAGIVKEKSYHFVDPTGANHWLASANYSFLYDQPGAIGVKTGFTYAAGYCVMGAATKDGRTMLAVVMDGYNPNQTAMDLVEEGFATPVADEPHADRLPAPSLPTPALPHPTARAGAGHGHSAPAGGAREREAAPTHLSAASRPAPGNHARRGLTAVLGTLPGTLLVLVAATACLVGLGEYLKLARLRRAQPLNLPSSPRTMAWVTTLGGSRRHRDDLVASYSRHERQHDGRAASR